MQAEITPYRDWYRHTQSRQNSHKEEAAQLLQYVKRKLTSFKTIEDPIIRQQLRIFEIQTVECLQILQNAPPSGISPDGKIQAEAWNPSLQPKFPVPALLPPLAGSPRNNVSLRPASPIDIEIRVMVEEDMFPAAPVPAVLENVLEFAINVQEDGSVELDYIFDSD